MASLSFETLTFEEKDTHLRVVLLKWFYFEIPHEDLERLGKYSVEGHTITFESISEKKASNKFSQLLGKYMPQLTNSLNGHRAVYVHRNSGIPLLGYIGLGVIDRGSSLIEVRPLTGCNINCPFCSVDEGLSTRKKVDFVIEKDYLIEAIREVAQNKKCDIEVNLNPQGEPTLYADMIPLIKDMSAIKNITEISMNTNGTFLTKEFIDELADAGMTQLNLSLNALDKKTSFILAGTKNYDVEKVLEVIEYIPQRMRLMISPVWVPNTNDSDIEELIKLYKKITENQKTKFLVRMGIQNYLNYRKGRNRFGDSKPMEQFYDDLKKFEQKYDVKLILDAEDFNIVKAATLPKPFSKGDIINADIVAPGRYPHEILAAASNRLICVHQFKGEPSGRVRIQITRDKDGLFDAIPL